MIKFRYFSIKIILVAHQQYKISAKTMVNQSRPYLILTHGISSYQKSVCFCCHFEVLLGRKYGKLKKRTILEYIIKNQMFRIFFKVHQVCVRLNLPVQIQIIISKQDQKIQISKKGSLINGIAILESLDEFFISSENPSFVITVIISYKNQRKFAGMYELNLEQWAQNSNNYIVSVLKKSPDSQATIQFQFIYGTSSIKSNKKLLTICQYQQQKNQPLTKIFKQRRDFLQQQNGKIQKQIDLLKKLNQQLKQHGKQMKIQQQSSLLTKQQCMRQKQKSNQCNLKQIALLKQKLSKVAYIMSNFESASNSKNNGQIRKLRQKINNVMQEDESISNQNQQMQIQ